MEGDPARRCRRALSGEQRGNVLELTSAGILVHHACIEDICPARAGCDAAGSRVIRPAGTRPRRPVPLRRFKRRGALTRQSQFKPDVTGWGQRGTLQVANILETMKDKARKNPDAQPSEQPATSEAATSEPNDSPLADVTDEVRLGAEIRTERSPERHTKKAKLVCDEGGSSSTRKVESLSPHEPSDSTKKGGMTLEEYEAVLDAEAADWDFPDGI